MAAPNRRNKRPFILKTSNLKPLLRLRRSFLPRKATAIGVLLRLRFAGGP